MLPVVTSVTSDFIPSDYTFVFDTMIEIGSVKYILRKGCVMSLVTLVTSYGLREFMEDCSSS
jgi:hypothetical protein